MILLKVGNIGNNRMPSISSVWFGEQFVVWLVFGFFFFQILFYESHGVVRVLTSR